MSCLFEGDKGSMEREHTWRTKREGKKPHRAALAGVRWADTPQIPSRGPPEAKGTLFCACVTEWNTLEAAWMGVAGVRPPRATTNAQVTKDGDPSVQLCSKEAGSGLSGGMCAITRDSWEEADTAGRGHWGEAALQTEKKVRTTAAVSSETRRARRFVSNAEREKKKNLSFLKICTQWNSVQKWRNKSFSGKQKLRESNISRSLL